MKDRRQRPRMNLGGGVEIIRKRAAFTLVRYQTTCAPVVIAYGNGTFELETLAKSIRATSHSRLHHSPDDPPEYKVLLMRPGGGRTG